MRIHRVNEHVAFTLYYFRLCCFALNCINHSRQMCQSRKLCNQFLKESQFKRVILCVQDVTVLWWSKITIQMLFALLLYVYARIYIQLRTTYASHPFGMWRGMARNSLNRQSIYATFTDTSSEITANTTITTTATTRFHSKFHDQIVLPLCCCCSFRLLFFSFLCHFIFFLMPYGKH